MTDRELLELAAKGAGIELRWHPDGTAYSDSRCKDYWGVWNPIADDGDALRLAVKLELKIQQNRSLEPEYSTEFGCNASKGDIGFECWNKTDPYAATRRAIVRAAAEIGRAKE